MNLPPRPLTREGELALLGYDFPGNVRELQNIVERALVLSRDGGVQRGFPKLGSEAFPGHLAMNTQLGKFMSEGGKVYACRFALQALYGHGEGSLIEGIVPINPLDVLDLILLHRRDDAFVINTWTM